MTIDKATAQRALETTFEHGGVEYTLEDFLRRTLIALWEEGEEFSGKRPLGDSDWDYDVIVGLVKADLVEGELDEYGGLDHHDDEAAHRLVKAAIDWLFS